MAMNVGRMIRRVADDADEALDQSGRGILGIERQMYDVQPACLRRSPYGSRISASATSGPTRTVPEEKVCIGVILTYLCKVSWLLLSKAGVSGQRPRQQTIRGRTVRVSCGYSGRRR